MSEIVAGPWGHPNETGRTTCWSWKPNSPITRIELVGSEYLVHTIKLKSKDNYTATYGQSNYLLQNQKHFGFDIKGPSEYLTVISGEYGHWDASNKYCFVSLKFETNLGNVHGPWPSGYFRMKYHFPIVPFSYKTPNGSPIVGFHGYSATVNLLYIKAIGVYVNSTTLPHPTPTPFILPEIVAGPWGHPVGEGNITGWSWKPSSPITRIELVGSEYLVHTIKFKAKDNYTATYGQSNYSLRDQMHFGFDINDPSEYLVGIRGEYGHWDASNKHCFVSLTFETNLGNIHGPWPNGYFQKEYHFPITSFSYKTPDGNPITGFHGYSETVQLPYIKAIGIYVKYTPPPPRTCAPPLSTPFILPNSSSKGVMIVGPWGGFDGTLWKYEPEDAIKQIDIGYESGSRVNYITFKTIVGQQSKHYGNTNGQLIEESIHIDHSKECLIGIKGTLKFSNDGKKMFLESLTFVTSKNKTHGPYGGSNSGYPFQYQVDGGPKIVGFFGLVDNYLNAIGVFVAPSPPIAPPPPPPPPPPPNLVFLKEWGGPDGKGWKFQPNCAIARIIIFQDNKVIHSLMFESEEGEISEKFGGPGGFQNQVDIKPGLSLIGIEGTYGRRGDYSRVTSLKFYTSDNKMHGHFGEQSGTEFSLSVDGSIVGFHGRSGALLDAIGVYVKPIN